MEQNTTLVARKIDETWEGCVIIQGKFVSALVGDDLFKLLTNKMIPFFRNDLPEGTEITITIGTITPEQKENDKGRTD